MQETYTELEAGHIKSVCTQFYYKVEKLCYRVVIHYFDNVMYKDFETYKDYQKNHDMLIRAMHGNSIIPNIFSPLKRENENQLEIH